MMTEIAIRWNSSNSNNKMSMRMRKGHRLLGGNMLGM